MSAKAILTARPNSFRFSDRVIDLDVPIKIGRAFKNEKSDSSNAYFDCKVLSKAHALLLFENEDSKFFLLDTGSSNGTFVNNIRLSKAGQESELTEVFTGDMLKFGADVLDKSRNVTQKCVMMKIQLFLEDGSEQIRRPSTSRLFRPSDSYEDVSIVTTNLQSSLSREKLLEDKLFSFKSIITKHSEDMDCKALITDLQREVNGSYDELNIRSKQEHDEKKLDKVLKENKELVMKCKEWEIKLNTKEAQCSSFQQKATDDAKHISNLGNIIEKLRSDIGKLENVVNDVKNTQQKVRDEYEETLMNQRKMFDDEIMEINMKYVKGTEKLKKIHSDDKARLEGLVSQLKNSPDPSGGSACWSVCSSVPSLPNTPSPLTLPRTDSQATNRSSISSTSSVRTVLHKLHKIVNHKGDVDVEGDEGKEKEDFDLSDDLDKSMELFTGMLKSKDDEIEMLNIKLLDMHKELEFQVEKDKDFEVLQTLAEDEADAISKLEQENCKLTESLNHVEGRLARDKDKWKQLEENVKRDKLEMKEKLNETIKEVEVQNEKYRENQKLLLEARDDILKLEEANALLKDQAISKWVDAAESDFDSMFQVMSDMIGISEAIREDNDTGSDDDSDTDTLTIVDDDRTECDVFLDELDDISEIAVDPS
eukprot:TRINITY_DN10775_c0_g1_i5.p1 TRINITY_DN10775_c0_g1~~TRINITY_DN10775_c0_g1_i5.p1  ORF type:complete len:650 (-),score=199.32 TRINITY_DN10775_c0_g1_i5:285-2234(-)